MQFGYLKNGKRKYYEIPKNKIKKPKKKRMRKKKFWLHCGDCGKWFTRYSQTNGKRNDGKSICHACIKVRITEGRLF
jgi:formylmethanofuran dehydrogenase subunit E